MRIGIDARAAAEERGGRGTVVRELLRRLPPEHDYVLFARERWEVDGPWRLDPAPDPLWHVRVGAAAHRHCDAFLSTNSYLTPWFTRVPSTLVVYDMVTFDPALAPQRRAALIEQATLPIAARRAAAAVAISAATARDLTARFGALDGKTHVAPLAAGPAFGVPDAAAVARVRAAYDLPERYVLAVGTLEPRKNLARLAEAVAGLDVDLVLVGGGGWDFSATDAVLARHAARIRRLGHVPDADLAPLYGGAAVFAYPSLYEGFGLPVLEAMACGAPVLTSDRSSLPEVAGDAALLVDPLDVGAIRAGVETLLADPARAAGGPAQAARFSWERFAATTIAVAASA